MTSLQWFANVLAVVLLVLLSPVLLIVGMVVFVKDLFVKTKKEK